jgi:hypothetical protein
LLVTVAREVSQIVEDRAVRAVVAIAVTGQLLQRRLHCLHFTMRPLDTPLTAPRRVIAAMQHVPVCMCAARAGHVHAGRDAGRAVAVPLLNPSHCVSELRRVTDAAPVLAV